MRGVPLRVEIGPRDVAAGQVMLVRRDPAAERKQALPLAGLAERVPALLDEIQKALFERAVRFREEHTAYPQTFAELATAVERGFAWAWWCGSRTCEDRVKEETKATTRCIPLAQPGGTGPCIVCGEEAHEQAVFARAY
jgi:prolyl-tRNA synthetase